MTPSQPGNERIPALTPTPTSFLVSSSLPAAPTCPCQPPHRSLHQIATETFTPGLSRGPGGRGRQDRDGGCCPGKVDARSFPSSPGRAYLRLEKLHCSSWQNFRITVKDKLAYISRASTLTPNFFLFFYNVFLFLVAVGLPCCVPAFSSCGEQRLLFGVTLRLLISVTSVVAEHRL